MAKITPVMIDGVPIPIRFGAEGHDYGSSNLKMQSQGNYRFYAIHYIPDKHPGSSIEKACLTVYSIKKQKNGQWYIESIKTRVYKRFGYSAVLTESADQRYSPGAALIGMFANSFPTLDKTVLACRMFEKLAD